MKRQPRSGPEIHDNKHTGSLARVASFPDILHISFHSDRIRHSSNEDDNYVEFELQVYALPCMHNKQRGISGEMCYENAQSEAVRRPTTSRLISDFPETI